MSQSGCFSHQSANRRISASSIMRVSRDTRTEHTSSFFTLLPSKDRLSVGPLWPDRTTNRAEYTPAYMLPSRGGLQWEGECHSHKVPCGGEILQRNKPLDYRRD